MLTLDQIKYMNELRDKANGAIVSFVAARENSKELKDEAVNVSDLMVTDVVFCESLHEGDVYYVIEIDEASPSANKFRKYVEDYVTEQLELNDIKQHHYFYVMTEW